MKQKNFKYPGDAAMEMFLKKHHCPTTFPVARMRFLGEIASLDFEASPVKTVESFWGGELPVFDGEQVEDVLDVDRVDQGGDAHLPQLPFRLGVEPAHRVPPA